MKCIIFILFFASFVQIYRFNKSLILPSQSSQQINYQGTLNQDQNTGSSEGVVFEGSIYSKKGLCLDYWMMDDGYQMLSFRHCNLFDGGKTQQWKFLSNGQIVYNNTGLCIQYFHSWYNLMITDCSNTHQLQFWTTRISTDDSQWMQFINVGYTKEQGDQQCMVQAEDFAELTECNSYDESQLFKFTPPPTIVFQGPIYSIISDLCLDVQHWDKKLALIQCNGNEKQHWIFFSTGHIIQKSSDQCIQYDRNFMFLKDCHINYSEQIWNYEMTTQNQQLQFINQGQTNETGVSQCMVQDGAFVKLHDCNTSQHNQFFSFVAPPPLPPSPPALNSGLLKSKYSYQCLDTEYSDYGYEMLVFTDCQQTNEYLYFYFFQNGQIKQWIRELCISYYPDKNHLMITTCNSSDLLQFWTKEDCQDNFCLYKNKGYSLSQGLDYCMIQDGQYAELGECDYLDESQFFTFSPIPSPPPFPPIPSPPPFPYDGDDDDDDDDYSDSYNDSGIVLIIIACIIGCILIIVPILVMFIRAAVTKQRQQQQQQQQEQEQQQIQQQQHSFINPSTNTSQVGANSTTRNQINGNSTATTRYVINNNNNNNNNNRYNSYGQPSIARRQQQQGAISLISGLNQRQNNELQEQLLERRIQDSLISDTFGGASTEVTCCICLDELREGDRETILPCAHQFHKKCFDEWLQTQKSRVACPLCNLHLKDTILP